MQMPQPMLAVNLRENARTVCIDFKPCPGTLSDQVPVLPRGRSDIERQRNRHRPVGLDVAAEIEAVLGIEPPLVASAGVLIENVREAQAVQEVGWCESDERWLADGQTQVSY